MEKQELFYKELERNEAELQKKLTFLLNHNFKHEAEFVRSKLETLRSIMIPYSIYLLDNIENYNLKITIES